MCIRDRVRTEVDTRGNQCSIFKSHVVNTPHILIARSLVKLDETGNVPIRVANILDQAVTLQCNTLQGKLTPVVWVAGMTQRRSSASVSYTHLDVYKRQSLLCYK